MKKPPCQKCGSLVVNLHTSRYTNDDPYLSCYTCGWRIYGDEAITAYVLDYNKDQEEREKEEERLREERRLEEIRLQEEAEIQRRKTLKRERDRRYREKKKALTQVYIIPSLDIKFRVGDLDPVLKVPWALPVPNKEGENLDPCAWPPCEERARSNSKYCSRKCTVRVAHRRDKLRKKGQLEEKIAS